MTDKKKPAPKTQTPTPEEIEAAKIRREQSDELAGAWRVKSLSKFLDDNLDIVRKNDDGYDIWMKNNRKVEWHSLKNDDGTSREVISAGVPQKDFTADDARNVIATCAARGWKSITLTGSDDNKAQMWLEAQRQGLAVDDYKPSEALQKAWEKEHKDALDAEQKKEKTSTFLKTPTTTSKHVTPHTTPAKKEETKTAPVVKTTTKSPFMPKMM